MSKLYTNIAAKSPRVPRGSALSEQGGEKLTFIDQLQGNQYHRGVGPDAKIQAGGFARVEMERKHERGSLARAIVRRDPIAGMDQLAAVVAADYVKRQVIQRGVFHVQKQRGGLAAGSERRDETNTPMR